MFCPNCGNQLPGGSKFCSACGTRMEAPVQQPVYQQPVYQPVTPAAPKKKSTLPVIIALILVAVLAVTAVWFFVINGKKTMYLNESIESITYTGSYESYLSQEMEYDEEVNLVYFERITGMSGDYGYENTVEIEYEYEDGRVVVAEFANNDIQFELEYIYRKKGVLEEIVGEGEDGLEIEAVCDKNGLIEQVEITENGETVNETTFEYDKEGNLEERTVINSYYETVTRYENGRVVETATYMDDELMSRQVMEYDEKGSMILQESYDTNNELQQSMEFIYTYDKDDKLTEFGISITMGENNGGETFELEGEAEWDGNEVLIVLDGELPEEAEMPGELTLEMEYDDHGNLLEVRLCMDEEPVMEYSYSYVEVKVSKDYEKFYSNDPYWFIGILG